MKYQKPIVLNLGNIATIKGHHFGHHHDWHHGHRR